MVALRLITMLVWLFFLVAIGYVNGVNRGDLLIAQVVLLLGITLSQIEITLSEIRDSILKAKDAV